MKIFFLFCMIFTYSLSFANPFVDVIQEIANCSVVNTRKYEIAEVLEARSRLEQSKNMYRPRLQGSINYGEQNSDGISFSSNLYSLDVGVPLFNRTINSEVQMANKFVNLSESKMIQKSYQITQLILQDIFFIRVKKQEIKILQEEQELYQKVINLGRATSEIGLSEKTDVLLAQIANEKIKSDIKLMEIENDRISKVFLKKYEFEIPEINTEGLEYSTRGDLSLNIPELMVINSEINFINFEVKREKSYFMPQVDLSAGIFSQIGVLPFYGYRVGISFDLSGFFRNTKIKSEISRKKEIAQQQKQRIKEILSAEKQIEVDSAEAITKQMESMKEALRLAEKAARILREKIRLGRSNFTDFVAIQNTIRSLRLDYSRLENKKSVLYSKQALDKIFSENKFSNPNISCALSLN